MAATLTLRTTATYCEGPHYFTVGVPTPHGVAVLVDHTTVGAPDGAVLVVYDPGDAQRMRAAQAPVFYDADGQPLAPVRARTVWEVELRDACGARTVIGVRATTRRAAWDAADAYGSSLNLEPRTIKPADRQVDIDAGR